MTFTPAQLAKPIRVGFIGLSAKGSWASRAHLPYFQKTSAYKITALLNSSVESAREARDAYGLPAETKLYGNPDDLAKDPDVDLVVCSARVDRHLPLTRPSLEAGKAAFVEWPLGRNLEEAEELTKLAEEKKVRTLVGMQSRFDPVGRKIRELVESGRIGKVLSVDVYSASGTSTTALSASIDYFAQRDIGGNMVTIHFGHLIEYITLTLGELKDFSARLKVGRPEVDIVDAEKNVLRRISKDTPDQIMLHGEFESSGALLNVHMRGGGRFKGEDHGLLWKIYGETGEIRVKSAMFLNIGPGEETTLWLHDFETDAVEQIDYRIPDEEDAFFDQLPLAAKNVARAYEAFAKGEGYPDFKEALLRHRLVAKLYESSEQGGKVVSYL